MNLKTNAFEVAQEGDDASQENHFADRLSHWARPDGLEFLIQCLL